MSLMCIAVSAQRKISSQRPLPQRFSPISSADSTSNLRDALARQVLARGPNEVGPLDIVIRSLSCPEATRVLREFILHDFIEPLAKRLDQPPSARIALVAALLAGVGLLRNVLHIAPLLDSEGG